MNRARISGPCVLAACGCGIVHDQITVCVCLEYLGVAHPALFPTGSPALLALCRDVAATFFIGLVFGGVLAVAARADPLPSLPAACLRRPVGALSAVMGPAAVLPAVGAVVRRRRFS